jgi:hypothetical protein
VDALEVAVELTMLLRLVLILRVPEELAVVVLERAPVFEGEGLELLVRDTVEDPVPVPVPDADLEELIEDVNVGLALEVRDFRIVPVDVRVLSNVGEEVVD